MVYYRCVVASALWMGASVAATNAKEDTKLRHGGAKGLMMRELEERRMLEGRELVSDDRQLGGSSLLWCCSAALSLSLCFSLSHFIALSVAARRLLFISVETTCKILGYEYEHEEG